jgi:hypothetical protein
MDEAKRGKKHSPRSPRDQSLLDDQEKYIKFYEERISCLEIEKAELYEENIDYRTKLRGLRGSDTVKSSQIAELEAEITDMRLNSPRSNRSKDSHDPMRVNQMATHVESLESTLENLKKSYEKLEEENSNLSQQLEEERKSLKKSIKTFDQELKKFEEHDQVIQSINAAEQDQINIVNGKKPINIEEVSLRYNMLQKIVVALQNQRQIQIQLSGGDHHGGSSRFWKKIYDYLLSFIVIYFVLLTVLLFLFPFIYRTSTIPFYTNAASPTLSVYYARFGGPSWWYGTFFEPWAAMIDDWIRSGDGPECYPI